MLEAAMPRKKEENRYPPDAMLKIKNANHNAMPIATNCLPAVLSHVILSCNPIPPHHA
jgi:hypothetical protein